MEDEIVGLLKDKHRFSLHCATENLPCVETVVLLRRQQNFAMDTLVNGESLFLKPNTGHAMRGCAELVFVDGSPILTSVSRRNEFTIQFNIEAKLRELIAREDYLVQKMLVNHPALSEHFNTTVLITLRVISVMIDDASSIVCCTLEFPTGERAWQGVVVDKESGCLGDFEVPFWTEALETVQKARLAFRSVTGIAWDLAITAKGPVIIEGNTGWGFSPVQVAMARPALSTKIADAYRAAILEPPQKCG